MRTTQALLLLLLAASPPTAAAAQNVPLETPPPFATRANTVVTTCKAFEMQFRLPLGTCLALERENSLNELATLCAALKQAGFFPLYPGEGEEGEPIRTVADCIAVSKAIEED